MFADVEVWAIPINTALLIILAVTNAYLARGQRRERRDLIDVKRSIGLDRRAEDGAVNGDHDDTGERRRVSDRMSSF